MKVSGQCKLMMGNASDSTKIETLDNHEVRQERIAESANI
jgi:hypothetical protein